MKRPRVHGAEWAMLVCPWLVSTAQAAPPRYRFATLGVGVDLIATDPGAPLLRPPTGSEAAGAHSTGAQVPATLHPRIAIGGLHFWGHADFIVHVPVGPALMLQPTAEGDPAARLAEGVETAARLYPWALSTDGLRPWGGLAWSTLAYSQDDDRDGAGPITELHRLRYEAGLSHRRGAHQLEAGLGYAPGAPFTAAMDRDTLTPLDADPWSVHVGWRRLLDTTIGLEQADASGLTDRRRQALEDRGALSGPELGVGVGVMVPTQRSAFGEADPLAFLGDRPPVGPMPDLSLGWFFHRPNGTVRMTGRPGWSLQQGFDAQRAWRRQSLSLDAVKFVGDAFGFVPFLGLGLSREALSLRAEDGGALVEEADGIKAAGSLAFGWDIRPNDVQSWLLRTNLRYTPGLTLDLDGGRQAVFPSLEVDFIQFVWYPRRRG